VTDGDDATVEGDGAGYTLGHDRLGCVHGGQNTRSEQLSGEAFCQRTHHPGAPP
jgi:hypothetical protein